MPPFRGLPLLNWHRTRGVSLRLARLTKSAESKRLRKEIAVALGAPAPTTEPPSVEARPTA